MIWLVGIAGVAVGIVVGIGLCVLIGTGGTHG